MPLMEWNGTWSVGIDGIDRQHQQLFKLINDLYDAMSKGQARTVVGPVVDALLQYTQTHFAVEEKYFKQFGYPDTPAHVREHVSFINKIVAFKRDYEGNRMGLSISVMNFLSDWLKNHIKVVDQKYAPFFVEKGVK